MSTRLDQIQTRLRQIPGETQRLIDELASKLDEQAKLADELNQHHNDFDLVRISEAKQKLGISPNKIREYEAQGLPVHRRSTGQVFVSKRELTHFLAKEQTI